MSHNIPPEPMDSPVDCENDDVFIELSEQLLATASDDIVRRLNWDVPIRELLPTNCEELSIRDLDVHDIGLSVRSRNCLGAAGIETVSQLLDVNIQRLMWLRNMGVRSVWDIILRCHSVSTHPREYHFARITECPSECDASAQITLDEFPLKRPDDYLEIVSRIAWDRTLGEILYAYGFDPNALSATEVTQLMLPPRAQHGLEHIGVETIEQLLHLTPNRILRITAVGVGTIYDIFARLLKWRAITATSSADTPEASSKFLGPQPAQLRPATQVVETSDPLESLPEIEALRFHDLAVSSLPYRDRKMLADFGITCLSDLVTWCKQKPGKRTHIAMKLNPIFAAARKRPVADALVDPGKILQHYYGIVFQKELSSEMLIPSDVSWTERRIYTILCARPRLAKAFMSRQEGRTLAEVGNFLGVTLKRAKQLTLDAEGRLEQYPGFVDDIISTITQSVRKHGGCLSICELDAELFAKAATKRTKPSGYYVKHIASLPEWQASALEMTSSHVILRDDWNAVQAIIRRIGLTVCRTCADQVDGANLWSSPVSKVFAEVQRVVNEDLYDGTSLISLTPGALTLAVHELPELVRIEGDRAYSMTSWALHYGTTVQQVEAILRTSGRPMHHSEITEEFRRWSIRKSKICGALERSNVALLWARGTYVHKNFVTAPLALLHQISQAVDLRLTRTPCFSVAGIFDEFQTECLASDIPTRQALYSLIKVTFPTRYKANEYPYITGITQAEVRTPVNLLIEEFVRSQGGYISRKQVLDYVINDLGVNPWIVPFHINTAPNVLCGSTFMVHTDNVPVNETALSEILRLALQMASDNQQVAIGQFLNSREVPRVQLGIDDLRLILELIVYRSKGKLIGKYPHFAAANGARKLQTIREVTVEVMRAAKGPCSMSALRSKLVDERGYSIESVVSALKQERIGRYTHEAFIHLDAINWQPEKQEALEKYARLEFQISTEKGRLCAVASELVVRWKADLPSLGSVIWTNTLVAGLLRKTPRWIMIGNALNAYVPTNNELGIKTLGDFVSLYLTRYHAGAARLDDLEEELREQGVLTKRLTQFMLGKQSQTVITENGEVMLR